MWMVIGGAFMGLAMAVLLRPFLPSRPKLAASMENMGSSTTGPLEAGTDVRSRIGAWMLRHVPALPFLRSSRRDLNLVGVNEISHHYQKAVWVCVGVVFVLVMGASVNLMTGLPLAVPVVLAIPAAVAGWWVPDYLLKARAAMARREFARAVAVYIELVAAERRRDAPTGAALENAAGVSRSWIFRRINQELTRARYDHRQPWDALLGLSQEIGVEELADAARIMRLSGSKGAAVYEALRAAGKSLRIRMLNAEHATANKASEQMSMMITVLALLFCGIVMTPLLMNLS